MMAFPVACPQCGARYYLADASVLGRRTKCSSCQHSFVVQTQAATAKSPPNHADPIQVDTTASPFHRFTIALLRLRRRHRSSFLGPLGVTVMWLGFAAAIWSGFEGYRHFA